jgi:flavin-dependent dehydrogenase
MVARFVIDATGRASAIARRLGARRRRYDKLVAVVHRVPPHADPNYAHAIVVEARPDGWWYAAPVPDGHVLAFLTDHDLLTSTRPRHALTIVAADSVVTDGPPPTRWLSVGDACAAHDPLFGWGVVRAFNNGILAADAVRAALAGDGSALARYHTHCSDEFTRYRDGLRHWYSREQRWPNSDFWSRRIA